MVGSAQAPLYSARGEQGTWGLGAGEEEEGMIRGKGFTLSLLSSGLHPSRSPALSFFLSSVHCEIVASNDMVVTFLQCSSRPCPNYGKRLSERMSQNQTTPPHPQTRGRVVVQHSSACP